MVVTKLVGVVVIMCAANMGTAGEPAMPSMVASGAKLVEVYADDGFFEGPTWHPASGKLYFTGFFKDYQQILRLDEPGKASVWMDRTDGVNGTYLSSDGRLLGAQVYAHNVTICKIGKDGPEDFKSLAHGDDWNQPNDVCQSPNGYIYFSDPDFGERKTSSVLRLTPDGKVTKVVNDMQIPNGLITSLDGKILYVADSYAKLWRCYPLSKDGEVGAGRDFFKPETENKNDPDGMTIDENGNLYLAGLGGVWVVDPEGKQLGMIPVPEFCSNLTFGGTDGKTLYLTCKGKVYSLAMAVRGNVPAK